MNVTVARPKGRPTVWSRGAEAFGRADRWLRAESTRATRGQKETVTAMLVVGILVAGWGGRHHPAATVLPAATAPRAVAATPVVPDSSPPPATAAFSPTPVTAPAVTPLVDSAVVEPVPTDETTTTTTPETTTTTTTAPAPPRSGPTLPTLPSIPIPGT
jgi:hypothetical protein